MNKKLISFVVPVLNEENNIFPLYESLKKVTTSLEHRYDFEIIFTDNFSQDGSFEKIREIAQLDKSIRAYRFVKNFGNQKSILAGYIKTKGEAIIQIDCDLQDPPELVPQFLEEWEKGNKVVYGRSISRKESFLKTKTRDLFYSIINFLSPNHLPHSTGEFRLIDKIVVEQLKLLRDENIYLRGTIASFGFRQKGIEYHRRERKQGKSKFPLRTMISFAVNSIISQSIMPLRIATFSGIIIATITLLSIIYFFITRIFAEANWPAGFTTTTILILFAISFNALLMGVIGEYLGRIYLQVRYNQQHVIISDSINDKDA